MALKDHKPAFEGEESANATQPATETATMTETMTEPTAPAASVPAVVASTAVGEAKPKRQFQMALAEQKDAFPLEAVIGLSMSIPRMKAEQGAVYVGDKTYGDKIRMTIESWDVRHLITAGLQSKDPGYQESVQYLANSYDGMTVEGKGGQTIDEYIAYLKSIGYDKAGAVKYGDLFGMVTWTAKDGEIAPENQQLHLLQASQTSLGNFMGFCTTQGLLQSKGIAVNLDEIEIHAMAQTRGTNKFTNFSFLTVKK